MAHGASHLKLWCSESLARLDKRTHATLGKYVASLRARPLRLGSMCSGTDAPVLVLRALQDVFQEKYGAALSFLSVCYRLCRGPSGVLCLLVLFLSSFRRVCESLAWCLAGLVVAWCVAGGLSAARSTVPGQCIVPLVWAFDGYLVGVKLKLKLLLER